MNITGKINGVDIFAAQAGGGTQGFGVLEYNQRWDAYFPDVVISQPFNAFLPLKNARDYRRHWIKQKQQAGLVVKGVRFIDMDLRQASFEGRFRRGEKLASDPFKAFVPLWRMPEEDRPPVIMEYDGYHGWTSDLFSPNGWAKISFGMLGFYRASNAEFFIAERIDHEAPV